MLLRTDLPKLVFKRPVSGSAISQPLIFHLCIIPRQDSAHPIIGIRKVVMAIQEHELNIIISLK